MNNNRSLKRKLLQGAAGAIFTVGAVTAFSGSAFAATHPTARAAQSAEVQLCSNGDYASQAEVENTATGASEFTAVVPAGQCEDFTVGFLINQVIALGDDPVVGEFQIATAVINGQASSVDVTTLGTLEQPTAKFTVG